MNTAQRWLKKGLRRKSYLVAPNILILIAVYQTMASSFGTLSRWKGGGFGMFSTFDSPSARFLKAYAITNKGQVPVQIPSRFAQEELLIETWPDRGQLERIAQQMAAVTWLASPIPMQGPSATMNKAKFVEMYSAQTRPTAVISTTRPGPYPDSYEEIHLTAIRIEVWRSQVDLTGKHLTSDFLMAVTSLAPNNKTIVQ